MINKSLQFKLKREIQKSGSEYEFVRAKQKNSFGEPDTSEYIPVKTLIGIYHEEGSQISITTGETTQTRNKKSPALLCLYDDTTLINVGDVVLINGKKCSVTGITNIQEWNIIVDISLEVVDNVIQT